MQALDRAKRLQSALSKLAERRDRTVEKANAEFRLDLLAALDNIDDETIALVLRGLAIDRTQEHLQLALSMALDERNHARALPVSTRRSGAVKPPPLPGDPHEAETDAPPAPPSLGSLEGDEDDLTELDLDSPLPPPPATPRSVGVTIAESPAGVDEVGDAAAIVYADGYRYPEPGEPAIELPDGRLVAAP